MDQAAFLLDGLPKAMDLLVQYFSLMNTMTKVVLFSLLVMVVQRHRSNKRAEIERQKKFDAILCTSDFPLVEPLQKFDWEKTEPLKLRPYKPKYHLTMGLENLDPSELILMDKTYKERITLRRELLKKYPDVVCRVNKDDEEDPRIRPAVHELYRYIMGIYLPNRYPQMFKLVQTDFETGPALMVRNLTTMELFPIQISSTRTTRSILETLIKSVDEDILILLPDQNSGDDNGKKNGQRRAQQEKNEETSEKNSDDSPSDPSDEVKYILEAYATCFPSGFDTREKLGKPLAQIHEPIPGYRLKLEKSMDRFFHKLPAGKYVKRVNWSVTVDAELFSPFGGIHAHNGEEITQLKLKEVDLDNTFLRCERQTLFRLPQSGAMVFSFHTYRYPIQEIKDEGSAEDLAAAIDGVSEGSIPEMAVYKRIPAWGEAIKEFLRS
ncbi:hypothetical protein BDDG_06337 [Blastomyces dermatitidis ATCC 18188]|uniref:HRQ family protein 2 n=1 Tax=Ajellomyces dermatitidis (strain ATCC 18188 / CBS 674.68) TaxID=653446 RepID=F2TJI0_AJEDA|nr:hypothetical protein BDDG_06337 [Blastomyces dermatitidis ATCC 18188]